MPGFRPATVKVVCISIQLLRPVSLLLSLIGQS